MAASYPTSIKNFTTKRNNVDFVNDSHINDLQDEMNAVQTFVGVEADGQLVKETKTQTLTNKTLTNPVLNGDISGTAFLDEDDMASDSATKAASQQSIKTYVGKQTSIASSATPAPTGDAKHNELYITALAAAAAFANPSGSAVNGNKLIIRVKDDSTGRALTYGSEYRALGVTLPTTTTSSKTLYMGFLYNSADTKWDLVASTEEA